MDLSKIKTLSQKDLKTLVKRRHPDYKGNVNHWVFMQETYRGGREWFESNIFKYVKEGEEEYADRIDRSYRFNHSREVTDLVNKYLFRAKINRSDSMSAKLKDFVKNVTKSGKDMDEFSRDISKQTSICGRIAIVVDSSNTPGNGVVTVEDEKKAGIRAYSYIVKPQHVLDYSFDKFGNLEWIMLREVARDDKDIIESSGNLNYRYRIWSKTDSILVTEKTEGRKTTLKVDDPISHNLNMVPVILADHIESDEIWNSPSLINDIAYLDRAVANYLSNLDAIIQDQTFSQLALPSQALTADDDMFEKMIEMGTRRIFTYDGEAGTGPAYISPDPKQAELIITAIKQIINEIYHSVGLAGERTKQDNAVGIDNSSGVAKAYDFERVNALLTSKAKQLERVEEKILKIVSAYLGDSTTDIESAISYSKTFDVRSLSNEFEIAEQLQVIEAPTTMRQEQMKALLEKLFPQIKKELKDKILNEIDKWGSASEAFERIGVIGQQNDGMTPADGGGKLPTQD